MLEWSKTFSTFWDMAPIMNREWDIARQARVNNRTVGYNLYTVLVQYRDFTDSFSLASPGLAKTGLG